MHPFMSRRVVTLTSVVLGLTLSCSAYADSETIYNRLLQSTGWINCPQPDGTNSWGTCWVVDREERLVVTNKHVVDRASKVMVDFPMYRDGQLIWMVSEYLRTAPTHGKVLAADSKRDLALCQLEVLPKGIVALPLANKSAVRGNKVYSMGNSSANTPIQEEAKLWRGISGKVDFRYFDVITFQKALTQKVEANTIRTTLPTASGDSGGPVVNTSGEVVAVHSNGDKFNSFSIDVVELKTFLDRAMQIRRLPAPPRDVVGTWTVATTDELGRCYWSLTVRANGTCLLERDEGFEGTFHASGGGDVVRLAIPGMAMQGEVPLTWSGDDQFAFTINGKDFMAVRR
jgi:S1-C subfamily serine protease